VRYPVNVPRRSARDRAILLLGFGAALRRSELVALALEVAVYVLNRMLEFGRPSYVRIV
jgi:site-specific recombinase XerC